jgi:lipid-binding SYLF domain-containing protein
VASAGEKGTVTSPSGSVLGYSDRKGLYGGAVVKGDAITPDNYANRVYYGESLTMREILFEKKVKPTEAATELAQKLANLSKHTTK